MLILGIETSCDETSAALVSTNKNSVKFLSNIVSSSVALHAKTGGIIPESAAREQIKYILPVIDQALNEGCGWDSSGLRASRFAPPIDAIAVTVGPGLIGSLLVGVETAKTLSYIWKKPLIPVNHLFGHMYANWIKTNNKMSEIEFPALALIVSGGHTDLVLVKNHGKIKWLGGTRDDAAGEAFDKIGRLLNLPYPAGPIIEQKAKMGNPKAFEFPRPMIGSDNLDFSFSGLKTAALREVQKQKNDLSEKFINDMCASVQQAVVDVIIKKTLKAAEKFSVKSILLSGGVAANQTLRDEFELRATRHAPFAKIFVPQKFLCTDNGAMIATAAFFKNNAVTWDKVTANPELYFD